MDNLTPAVPQLRQFPVDQIKSSPHQARQNFEEEPLKNLAESMNRTEGTFLNNSLTLFSGHGSCASELFKNVPSVLSFNAEAPKDFLRSLRLIYL